jgi:hypothetical protein
MGTGEQRQNKEQEMETWKIINRGTILIDRKNTGRRYQLEQIETIK